MQYIVADVCSCGKLSFVEPIARAFILCFQPTSTFVFARIIKYSICCAASLLFGWKLVFTERSKVICILHSPETRIFTLVVESYGAQHNVPGTTTFFSLGFVMYWFHTKLSPSHFTTKSRSWFYYRAVGSELTWNKHSTMNYLASFCVAMFVECEEMDNEVKTVSIYPSLLQHSQLSSIYQSWLPILLWADKT